MDWSAWQAMTDGTRAFASPVRCEAVGDDHSPDIAEITGYVSLGAEAGYAGARVRVPACADHAPAIVAALGEVREAITRDRDGRGWAGEWAAELATAEARTLVEIVGDDGALDGDRALRVLLRFLARRARDEYSDDALAPILAPRGAGRHWQPTA